MTSSRLNNLSNEFSQKAASMNTSHILKSALQHLSEVIIITDDNGELIYVSPNCHDILGFHEDTIFEQDSIVGVLSLLNGAPLKNGVKSLEDPFEFSCQMEDGSPRHLRVRKLDDQQKKSTTYLFADISARKKRHALLKKINEDLELRLEEKTTELQRKDIALAEVMNRFDVERNNLVRKVDLNTQKLLLPILERLIDKSSSLDSRYLTILKQNLQNLTSSFGMRLASIEYKLTPKEIELCTLIKGGFTIKEIATMQNLSERTVETHRFNIRKKLGLSSTKKNLATFLAEL